MTLGIFTASMDGHYHGPGNIGHDTSVAEPVAPVHKMMGSRQRSLGSIGISWKASGIVGNIT